MLFSALPEPQGLYDPANESDSCGVAMVTDIQGRRSHSIVTDGLIALEHLEHRGAAGAEPNSGDGAGILIQLPVELLRDVVDFELPASGDGLVLSPSWSLAATFALPGMQMLSHSSHETLALSSSGPGFKSAASFSGTIRTTWLL